MAIDAAIIDLDGTVYRGDQLLARANTGIEHLRDAGVEILYFSNNPTKTPAETARRLRRLGISVPSDRVLTSGTVTQLYLDANHADDTVFIIGEAALVSQLSDFEITAKPRAADVLVASIDRDFTYDKLTDALWAIETDPVFLGTDPDRTIPGSEGDSIPGSGAIIGAISNMTGREPEQVLGKPSDVAVNMALDRVGVPAQSCLVVGDRLDTDIAMGNRAGMTTVLVTTGTHTRSDRERIGEYPDYVVDSLAELEDVLSAESA